MQPPKSLHTSRPARVRRVGLGKEPATSSQRGPRVRIYPNVEKPRFETRKLSDKMTAQTFFQKSDAALIDTFLLIGVDFSGGFLNSESFNRKDIGTLAKELKTFVSGFIALALNDELPPGFIPQLAWKSMKGRPRSFLKTRILSKRNIGRKLGLAAMINYSKRLFPSLPATLVNDKVQDFTDFVCSPDTDILHNRSAIEEAIYQEVQRLPRFKASWLHPFTPSSSSCIEAPRNKGGITGQYRDLLSTFLRDHPWLEKLTLLDRLDEDVMFSEMKPIWASLIEIIFLAVLSAFPPVGPWIPHVVEPIGLGEPLKVRVITKSTYLMQILQPIQVAWHSTMRRDPVYELIGGVPVEQSIRPLRLHKGQKFVSGDYEAATDRIHLHYTEFAARCMLAHTDFELPAGLEAHGYSRQVLLDWFSRFVPSTFTDIVVHHSIVNGVQFILPTEFVRAEPVPGPDKTHSLGWKRGSYGDYKPLHRGQMMGHILSFPLLCLINKSVSMMALPKDRFIRVNGDDVLFAATPEEYRQWEIHTRHVGLKKSVGKNYYSRDMAMINSEIYTWDKKEDRLVRLQIPNVGLLGVMCGTTDPKTGREIHAYEQLGGVLREFWKGIQPRFRPHAVKLIRKRYSKILDSFPGSMFGPTTLGNLGLPVPEHVRFSRYQLRYMEAHRTGQFSVWEGTRSDYSAIEKRYQMEILEQDPWLLWGVPGSNPVEPLWPSQKSPYDVPLDVVPDPYSRSGGYSRPIMQMRQWFVSPTSVKHSQVFGRRRFNRFLLKNPDVNVLGGSALESVLMNTWSREREHWYPLGEGPDELDGMLPLLHDF